MHFSHRWWWTISRETSLYPFDDPSSGVVASIYRLYSVQSEPAAISLGGEIIMCRWLRSKRSEASGPILLSKSLQRSFSALLSQRESLYRGCFVSVHHHHLARGLMLGCVRHRGSLHGLGGLPNWRPLRGRTDMLSAVSMSPTFFIVPQGRTPYPTGWSVSSRRQCWLTRIPLSLRPLGAGGDFVARARGDSDSDSDHPTGASFESVRDESPAMLSCPASTTRVPGNDEPS